jgi:hypothetical protein
VLHVRNVRALILPCCVPTSFFSICLDIICACHSLPLLLTKHHCSSSATPSIKLSVSYLCRTQLNTIRYHILHQIFILFSSLFYFIFLTAALRTGALTPAGDKVTVGCLAKVEMNVQANAMRITFRTLHPSATAALMATAKIAML